MNKQKDVTTLAHLHSATELAMQYRAVINDKNFLSDCSSLSRGTVKKFK
jgi:hypothetical protein